MVPKKSLGSWCLCVDYTNLNRACPKDSFPLPRIDQLIDSTAGYWLLNFMDVFSGYNQIQMNPADEEHNAFTTDKGLYCYQVMPFRLKNAGATYQRLVNSMFVEVIGTIMEKCIFGVEVGKFLGYIISHKGIEPEKVQAILDMISPTYRNEVQSLTGKVAALSRFISRLTDKCTPFFKLLKTQHVEVIARTTEHEAVFLYLKAYLAEVPLLYKPVPGEMLYIYLEASSIAVSSALIRKYSDCEYSVYYSGKGYTGAESRYPDIEKITLALLAIELGELNIKYQPRTAIKGQAAANFISESIPSHNPTPRSPKLPAPDPPPPSTWRLYVDGASNKKTSGAGILLISPDDQVYEYALKFAFKASNNTAEYETLIAGLQIAWELGIQHLHIFSDSQLVVNQIPRAKNDKADALARIAATSPSPTYGATKVEILERPSTCKTMSEIFTVDHIASLMDPILKYMVDGLTPDDKVEAQRLQLRSARYTIMNGKLYSRSHCFPNLKCVTPEDGHKIMKDIHAGVWSPEHNSHGKWHPFDNDELRAYTENLGTRILYASPAHPQTNGQVEDVNKIIKKILKKKLDKAKGLWVAKLPKVLWAIRTTATEAT
ncbi:uncharacterized protein LOC112183573 [Rosa chinensis]|uniref:uncharacterized protein LOC112183573 n=1 Tax=Rosa chinensis TaxID=74649 RepID=UPI000D08EA4C|nr:uncharacterized protein LOC112183573 [Rosa chinensis]